MKGTYFLLIEVKKDIRPKIGSLGRIKFKKGVYVYVGSALNNLEKRIERHKKMSQGIGVKHWHIDYLLSQPQVRLLDIYYKEGGREECKTARQFASFAEGVKGFGCSDCRCESHLFYLS